MNGLCAPSEQGNAVDGLWLEHKEVLRLRKIAVNYHTALARARRNAFIFGVSTSFIGTAILNMFGASQ